MSSRYAGIEVEAFGPAMTAWTKKYKTRFFQQYATQELREQAERERVAALRQDGLSVFQKKG